MKVTVNHELCRGHGLCYFESDQLFELRDLDGKSVVLHDPVPEELNQKARDAVELCPERAISVIE
ncbi:MAG: ferredoxin [Actinomycetes bacterium]